MSSIFIAQKEKENYLLDSNLNNVTNKIVNHKKNIISDEKFKQKKDFSNVNNQSYKISINDNEVQKNSFLKSNINDFDKNNIEIIVPTDINPPSPLPKDHSEKNFFLELFQKSLIIQ